MTDDWLEYVRDRDTDERHGDAPLVALVGSSRRLAWLWVGCTAGLMLFVGLMAVVSVLAPVAVSSMSGRVVLALLLICVVLTFPIPFLVVVAERRFGDHGPKRTSNKKSANAIHNGEALRRAARKLGWSENLRYVQIVVSGAIPVVWLIIVVRVIIGR